MYFVSLRWIPRFSKLYLRTHARNCHGVFGIKELILQEKPDNIVLEHVESDRREEAVTALKQLYLPEHVMVRARSMDLRHDKALDQYLFSVLQQGNSIFAKTTSGILAGICVNFACSPVDVKNLRSYAFYRQDPNTKDFLYFTAKLQETPNLWDMFKVPKVFEIKMLAVVPEFRRQGLAIMLAESSKELATDQGYSVVRMDCINPHDYKVAERCALQCVSRFPLHELRGAHASFIARDAEHNRVLRVYAGASARDASDAARAGRRTRAERECLVE